MTKLSIFLFLALLIAGCNNPSQQSEQSEKSDNAAPALTELSLHIKGMSCVGCENTINQALSKVKGVYESKASHVEELVTVIYDANVATPDQITESIAGEGYKVIGEIANNDTE